MLLDNEQTIPNNKVNLYDQFLTHFLSQPNDDLRKNHIVRRLISYLARKILKINLAPKKEREKLFHGTPQDVIVRYKNANILSSQKVKRNVQSMNFSHLLIKPSSILLIPAHRHKNHAHENYLKIEHNFAHYPHSIENETKRQAGSQASEEG